MTEVVVEVVRAFEGWWRLVVVVVNGGVESSRKHLNSHPFQ